MPKNEAKKLAARIQREKTTVTQMTMLYCRAHHQTQGGLCPECAQLAFQIAHPLAGQTWVFPLLAALAKLAK